MTETLDARDVVSPSDVDVQHPWLGLSSFTEELQAYFFGRSDETDELLRRVKRKVLTVLFGQSGLGKTSLLRAGVFPHLRSQSFLPVLIRIDYSAEAPAPTRQIKAAVDRAVEAAGFVHPEVPQQADLPADSQDIDEMTLWEFFHRREFGLRTSEGTPVNVVLVFDQFEELFTLGGADEPSRERSAPFLTELAELIESRVPDELQQRIGEDPDLVERFSFGREDYRVLFSLREDYLPNLEGLRQCMPSIAENRMRLTRMTGLQALEAVSRPGGDLVLPSVSRQIVRFVAGAPHLSTNGDRDGEDYDLDQLEVEPALLSLFCRELNTRRLANGLPEITADLLAGSREHILHDFYDRCIADQPPQVQAFIEEELLTDSGYRENMALERAQKALQQRGAPSTAIDELVKRRLLHVEERLQVRRVELTHDVLTEVVKKSRDQRWQREQAERAEQREQQVRLQLSQSRKRLALTVGVAAFLIGVISASIYWYRYAQVLKHVTYYNAYTKRYGEPVGIGRLTSANVAARRVSLKFTRKGRDNPVIKIEAVNSSGELTTEHGVGTYLRQASESKTPAIGRECRWEFVYDNNDRVVYEKAFDKFGNMVWGFVYSPMSRKQQAHGHFVGPNGYPYPQRESAAEYVKIEYTTSGWERSRRYYDRKGQRQPGPDRAFGQLLDYNEQGLITHMMSVDANDRLMIDAAGNCGLVSLRFDRFGNALESLSVGPDGEPMPVLDGWTTLVDEFDSNGNQVGQRYLDASGQPVVHKELIAGWSAVLDDRGNETERRFLGLSGELKRHKDGNAGYRSYHDHLGRVNGIRYFDEFGEPTRVKDGYAGWSSKYDAAGNESEVKFLDESGQPVSITDGYACWKSEFDGRGNELERRYFDASGQPTRHVDGNGGWTATFDDRGNQKELSYIDESGQPVSIADGFAGWESTFDERGNEIERRYFDTSRQPTRHVDGNAGWIATFDDRGNQKERSYFDESDRPVSIADGYAGWTSKFDELGNETEVRYFDESGQPTRHTDGNAGWTAAFDDRGNETELKYIDESGEPTLTSESIAGWTSSYDDRGNETERSYFDKTGQPTRHKDGNTAWRKRYNSRDERIEEAYFDEHGNPTAIGDGYTRLTLDHDETGRERKLTYFYELQPHAKGYQRELWVYDDRGNRVEEAYFDLEGNPVASSDGYARESSKYDDSANLIESAYFAADDRPAPYGTAENCHTRTRFEYDDTGQMRKRAFEYESSPHPNGYRMEVETYDEKGRLVAEAYFDLEGRPVVSADGYAAWKKEFDENGRERQTTYLDQAANPTLNEDGVATIKYERDEQGLITKRSFFGVRGEPTLSNESIAGWTSKFDDRGNEAERHYFDATGKPARHTDGNAGWTARYNSQDKLAEKAFFDEQGEPASIQDGYTRLSYDHDETGRERKRTYFYELQPHVKGYQRELWVYDDRGNRVEEAYFDLEGNPVASSDGYARESSKYDDAAKLIESAYFAADDRPAPYGTAENCHTRTRFEYDDTGQMRKRTFEYESSPHPNGYRMEVETYDETGRLVAEAYFDLEGRPAVCADGYAAWKKEFDENGRERQTTYLDQFGNPTLTKEQIAGWASKYDDRGNETERRYFDAAGGSTRHQEGYATLTARYNAQNMIVEMAYFDEEGKPATIQDGLTRQMYEYDDAGRQRKRSFFYEKEPHPKGYQIEVRMFDDRANQIGEEYFDRAGNLVAIPDGYARVTAKYNENNQLVEIAYFDVGEKPARNSSGYYRRSFRFDDAGEAIERRSDYQLAGVTSTVVGRRPVDGETIEAVKNALQQHSYAYEIEKLGKSGDVVEVSYHDHDGTMTLHPLGYARAAIEFNEDGTSRGHAYFDTTGKRLEMETFISRIVEESQGERLGLQAGDVLLTYDGNSVTDYASFIRGRDQETPEDGPKQLVIRRGDEEIVVEVVPGQIGAALRDRARGRQTEESAPPE